MKKIWLILLLVIPCVLSAQYTSESGSGYYDPQMGGAETGGASTLPIIQIKGQKIESMKGKFSGTFQNTSVAEVIRMIALQSELNIMIGQNVNGTVTVTFKDIAIKDAFSSILSANNLYYIEQGNLIKILNYEEYRQEVMKNFIETRAFDASIIDTKNLPSVIKPLLTPGIGIFSIDNQSSKIIVTDIKDNLDKIQELFNELGAIPKVVEIEARIIEIELNDTDEVGVNWTALNLGKEVNLEFKFLPTAGISAEVMNISGSHTLDSGEKIDALISVLSRYRKINTISQPRVLAVNRGEASILIGNKVPYSSSMQQDSTSGQQTSQVEFADVGIKLVVKPVITENNEVRMSIKAELSTYDMIAISTTQNAPKITTTTVSCDAVALNGQPIAIGGLFKTEKTDDKKTIPLIGKIPFLNYLFGHSSESVKKSELAILITPRIVNYTNMKTPSLKLGTKEINKEAGLTNK